MTQLSSNVPTEIAPVIDDFADGLLTYHRKAGRVLEIVDDHADVGALQIAAGILTMLGESTSSPNAALRYADRAKHLGDLSEVERAYLVVLDSWINYDIKRATTAAEAILADHPTDLLALRLAQYFQFGRGDYPAMLRSAQLCEDAAADQASYWTMAAFAHEQCHQIDAAHEAAETALALNPDHPWGHHALAHVHLTRGNVEAGLEMMRAARSSWVDLNSFMFTHNWWHLALFELATGGARTALKIYDEHCWGIDPGYSQDQVGAVSMLIHLEFAGVDVGDRWRELRPYLERRTDDPISPFRTLHYLYGLARSRSEAADELLATIRRQTSDTMVPADLKRWKEVGLPAAEGIYAAAVGQPKIALQRLTPVLGRMWQLGGSHAQRDVFQQIWLHALMSDQQWVDAQQAMQLRQRWIPDHPVTEQRLERIYRELDLRH